MKQIDWPVLIRKTFDGYLERANENSLFDEVSLETVAFAAFSTNKLYRYLFGRIWNHSKPPLVALMCNPSTADAFKLDNTVKGMIARAKKWGFGGLIVINMYAYKGTDPKTLKAVKDIVGELNHRYIKFVLSTIQKYSGEEATVIAGWGGEAHKLQRNNEIEQTLRKCVAPYTKKLYALRLTKDGHPYHPLYVKHAAELIPYKIGV